MFPNGLPGVGLLLLRLVGGGLVIAAAIAAFVEKPQALLLVMQSVACAAALLLLVGRWTPIAGVAIAVLELWTTVSRTNGMPCQCPRIVSIIFSIALGDQFHFLCVRHEHFVSQFC